MNALAASAPEIIADETALVRRFLAWAPNATPQERARAVNALARAYLYSDLSRNARGDIELALTGVLDDPDPRVRRALAEALASAREAPRAIVLALASDVSHVARPLLLQSPLLRDPELVDCAAIGDARAQAAIARRARLSPPVAAALCEIGERAAVLALIGNLQASLGRSSLWRLFERFHDDAEVRARLIERPGLPAALRAAVAAATTAEVAAADWLDPRRAERIARDGREQAFVAIATDCPDAERAELATWLRANGHLTVSLLLRALCCGDAKLFNQSLAEMSGLPPARVAGLLRDTRGQGFASIYARANMPAHLEPAFRIAVAAMQDATGATVGVNTPLTQKILRAIEARNDEALAPATALLWRFASEGARADAREYATLALLPAEAEPAPEILLELEPAAPPVLMLNVEPGNENFAPPVTIELVIPEPEAVAA